MDPAVTAPPDGVVHITAEYELPADDQDEPENAQPDTPNEATEVLVGADRAVRRVLGGIWEAIKPDDSPPAEPEEE